MLNCDGLRFEIEQTNKHMDVYYVVPPDRTYNKEHINYIFFHCKRANCMFNFMY